MIVIVISRKLTKDNNLAIHTQCLSNQTQGQILINLQESETHLASY